MTERYLDVTQEAGAAFFSRGIQGEIIMLNLLRFREIADYGDFPKIAPAEAISGRRAYHLYMKHTQPFLDASGGSMMLLAETGNYLIGRQDEVWDVAMLVRQASAQAFITFASDPAYLAGIGHRTAALEDSRLLPLMEIPNLFASAK
ncbi:MAG: DUF1330 domain-containing protein [Aggregatilineales bacterium]